jgi:hypothetical protein
MNVRRGGVSMGVVETEKKTTSDWLLVHLTCELGEKSATCRSIACGQLFVQKKSLLRC